MKRVSVLVMVLSVVLGLRSMATASANPKSYLVPVPRGWVVTQDTCDNSGDCTLQMYQNYSLHAASFVEQLLLSTSAGEAQVRYDIELAIYSAPGNFGPKTKSFGNCGTETTSLFNVEDSFPGPPDFTYTYIVRKGTFVAVMQWSPPWPTRHLGRARTTAISWFQRACNRIP